MIHIVAALGALLASFLRGSEGAAATIPQVGEGQSAAARHTGGTSTPGNARNWVRESVPLFVFFWGACCRCRWAASPGRSAHQRGTPGPATPATGFGGLFILSCSLAGEASPKLVAGVAARSVCWRCDASVPPAGVFADPTVRRTRYRDNLCPPYLMCWNGFRPMKTKAIGYVRVSTDKQAEHGVSLEAQVEKIRAMATVHDVELLDVIVDAGESAKDLDRPGMVRILDLVQSRAIGMVIVAKLDRLTRSVKDLALLLEQFQRRGVSLVSVTGKAPAYFLTGRMR